MFETPVALFVFNRPDTTRRVFEAIAKVQPSKLLLIADGPRAGRPDDATACLEVRNVLSRVDWPCEVVTNFANTNLGCQERMMSGIDWVFSLVEEAILLEDDCLPDPTFFTFCRQLLEKYRGDGRVNYISGDNFVTEHQNINASYYFSRIGGIWGWATWRSEWQRYDRHLSDWPQLRKEGMLAEIFDETQTVANLTRIFDAVHKSTEMNAWDYQWVYTGLKNNSVIAVPGVNLVTNIGFGATATHTTEPDLRFCLASTPMEFPLRHPLSLTPSRSLDAYRTRDMFSTPIHSRAMRLIRRVVRRMRR